MRDRLTVSRIEKNRNTSFDITAIINVLQLYGLYY